MYSVGKSIQNLRALESLSSLRFVASVFRHMSLLVHLVCRQNVCQLVSLFAFHTFSQFSFVKSNSPTPRMNGSWLSCLIRSQNTHGLPKLVRNQYTDVLSNPLHSHMMGAQWLTLTVRSLQLVADRVITHLMLGMYSKSYSDKRKDLLFIIQILYLAEFSLV